MPLELSNGSHGIKWRGLPPIDGKWPTFYLASPRSLFIPSSLTTFPHISVHQTSLIQNLVAASALTHKDYSPISFTEKASSYQVKSSTCSGEALRLELKPVNQRRAVPEKAGQIMLGRITGGRECVRADGIKEILTKAGQGITRTQQASWHEGHGGPRQFALFSP